MSPLTPLVRCGGCGDPPDPGATLRRGRCLRCYDVWVRARPVGVGASCSGCENRRRVQLRHYELGVGRNVPGGRWIILCHNCVAFADSLDPPPHSIEGLRMRLQRDRRWGDRRAESVGRKSMRAPWLERRADERRVDERGMFDATDLAEEVLIEMEADYELEGLLDGVLDGVFDGEEVTGIHFKMPAE